MLNNKILVIDDEVIVIESILEDLNGMGFKFISAANGKDGLAKYEEEKPILVILDLRMPGMNGVEFLENLGIRLNDQCTVIVLTGHGDEDDIKKCFDLGISSFIRKPYNIDVLRGTIRHAIKLKQVQQELIDAINERKKMEEVLLQSEKLKSIGTITAGISHEFNNILAIISGNIELLTETYKDHIELTDVLRTIGKTVKDGAEISRNMLKFAKTKQDTKEFVSSDIRDLIMQSLEFTMPRWKNMAQIEGLNYQIDKEGMKEVSSIMCNPTEIREVFINIINNAFDAMPEGGSLSFSTWDRDEVVFVKITDSGEGMPEDVKKNIFDPFFTTKTPLGTGLGMSIAYGTVARHVGKIGVESEVGKGSTFTLQFPSTIKTASSIFTPKPEQKIKSKNLSILVVDDEEEICNMLEGFLSKRGNKVKTVDNGADAIGLINNEHFDLVLCDLAMPNVSGYDVIKVINELEKIPKTGIITGWGERVKRVEEEGMKVDFVLKKPFDLSSLTKHINDVFGKGSTDTEAS